MDSAPSCGTTVCNGAEGTGWFSNTHNKNGAGPLMRVRHRPKIAANEPLQTATVDSWAHVLSVVLLGGAVYMVCRITSCGT